jgi:nucleotide-binding universal stress UspA family protein
MKKIAVSLDGSELSQTALPWAQILSGPETEIHLIKAFLEPQELLYSSLGPVPVDDDDLKTEEVIEEIRKYLQEQASTLEQPVKMHAGCGNPAETILYQADRREVDLIVMASHGRGGMDRWLLGSVATKVLRGSQIPVLVIRPQEEPKPPALNKIMVPLDGSDTSEKALEMALEVAKSQEAELLLYMGLSFPRTGFPTAVQQYVESGLKVGEEYLDEQAAKCEGVTVSTVVRDTTPGHGIVKAAADLQADMIIMGSHGRSGVSRWILGSVTENVVQTSDLPVMVVYQPE